MAGSIGMSTKVVPISPWEVIGVNSTLELERWRFDQLQAAEMTTRSNICHMLSLQAH